MQKLQSLFYKIQSHKASRLIFSIIAIIFVYLILQWGVGFIRDIDAPERILLEIYTMLGMNGPLEALQAEGMDPFLSKAFIAVVAIVVGVGGIWLLYWAANEILEQLPVLLKESIRPYVFLSPAMLLLTAYLVVPAVGTIFTSFSEGLVRLDEEVPEEFLGSEHILQDMAEDAKKVAFDKYYYDGVNLEIGLVHSDLKDPADNRNVLVIVNDGKVTPLGFGNYEFAFTSPDMHVAFRNNVLWLLIGTGGSVGIGLLVATLMDRVKREALAKSFIFMPLAISMAGASVIWKFVYAWAPVGKEQIGLLNAITTSLGFEPVPWVIEAPVNTYAFIVIMIWLQTGFAMVVLSAALKGVDNEVIEAARIDGADEFNLFFRIILPMIKGSLITVTTTIFIAILKVFDIVYVMTRGQHDTEVIANRMFVEMFNFFNYGRASSLAVILLVVTIPIMVVNIRNMRRQGINQ